MRYQEHPAKQAVRQDDEAVTAEAGEDLRDEQLDEDVACCLAGVDELLAEQVTEREKAEAEFRVIKARYESAAWNDNLWGGAYDRVVDELRVWQAMYAHLGLSASWCCGDVSMTSTER